MINICIILNLGILIYFKYAGFVLSFLDVRDPKIHLPLGISFFVFQAMSYTIDVYRKDIKPSKSFHEFLMYISFFPQLVAGPIVRYIDINNEIRKKNYDVIGGIEKFILGLSKKVLIADQVAFYADFSFGISTTSLNSSLAWLGILSYSLQIYFDFSGYSDMAIGLGRIFGFKFLENFNYPYIATSIQDFWRRWHISLSTWFRDYLYIPLGGNRISTHRTYINQFAVFFLCGLWHGAAWNFVIWGVFHGMLLTFEKFFGLNHFFEKNRFFGHSYSLLMIMIGWVFFRSDNLKKSFEYIYRLFSFSFKPVEVSVLFLFLLVVSILVSSGLPYNLFSRLPNKIKSLTLVVLFFFCSAVLTIQGQSPFIYFRF
ncbi:MAG: MBOAT family protein [Bacteriovoracaceae bacterium]|nr:MBOAT family protein [Bacteriovoracaceae bacterium]